jgi:peptidoglycan hydrolase-like protein with peptidoglycan-binding domain
MRSKNLQVLTDQIKTDNPGVVIYGIGDAAHKLEISDHNEDDTPGSKAEQSDSDNNPEHRAIDVMIGPNFSKAAATNLKNQLVTREANKARLKYVILFNKIYSAKRNFAEADYTGEYHNHVHVSANAADDENETPWDLDGTSSSPSPAPSGPRELKQGVKGDDVGRLQQFFRRSFPIYRNFVNIKRGQLISVDNDFGPQTKAWVIEFQRRTGLARDGIVGPNTREKLGNYGYTP